MTSTRTALVIGGGIAGPAAAMALRRAGIEATVYEAQPRTADGAGVFLTLASNGVDALRTIGAESRPLAAGFATPRIILRSGSGKRLGEVRTGVALGDGTTSHTLKRADLYRAIHGEATAQGVVVEYAKRLVDTEETGNGVRALFEDGSDAVGDIMVGADGVHSTVRRLIDPNAPAPKYVGLLSLGGYARGVRVDAEPGSYTLIFGKRAFFGYVLPHRDEVWWFANVPRADEPRRGEAEALTADEWRSALLELYAEDAGPALRLLEATETAEIMKATPVHSIPHLPVWHNGRVIAIGDAAHAPTPTSGQGASLAIEDAVVLAKCLRDVADPREAFNRYETLRRARVEGIIKQAARFNRNKAAGPLGRASRDALLLLVLKATTNSKRLNEAYAYHIDWNTPVGAIRA
jgi:2-polyprenyl-6-methoxyphenol hydroxylase-like FAD-dependent oxidoreductase